MTGLVDADGTPLRRDRDGTLVPESSPDPAPYLEASERRADAIRRCREAIHQAQANKENE